MLKLSQKKAIVTGANRSIGQAIALAFAREGADVLISYRSDEKGAKVTQQTIERLGCRSKALQADFSNPAEIERFFNEALAFLGTIDILVNNAAGYSTTGFFDLTIGEFEQLLQVNVIAPMRLIQLTAKQMIEKGIAGSIINISAISGNRPVTNRVAFGTSKAALHMLTQTISLELAPYQIRVNAILPGSTPYEQSSAKVDSIPLQRMGKPEDQAQAALYLASEASSWVTGQLLIVDGGQSLSFQ